MTDGADIITVRLTGQHTKPYFEDGEYVCVDRRGELRDGDVGLFFARGHLVCRQYCEDYAGNVYLFALDRSARDADMRLPASAGYPLVCFGRVLDGGEIPLP